MTRYGLSFWLARHPKSRVSAWPRYRGETGMDIAVVGGGLTGCAVAYAFAAAGYATALFEAGRIGRAATGAGDGILSLEPWPSWRELETAMGRRDARLARDVCRLSALEFAATLRRLKVRCDLLPQRAATIAVGGEAERALERDCLARKDAGLDSAWLAGARLRKEIGAERGAGLFTTGAVTFDPYRACLGLARAAAGRGCQIFEMSAVAKVHRRADGLELRLASGTFAAQAVVLATGAAGLLAPKLARHFRPTMMHHVATPSLPAPLRKAMGVRGSVVRFAGVPSRRLRWTEDNRVIFSGGDHAPVPARSRDRAVIQRTGQLMYELSLIYPAISGVQPDLGWDTALWETSDGIPFIGPHRAYPRHLFAVGADRAGAAGAWLAARLLVRQVAGAPEKGDELFGFGRLLRPRA
jgi:glycine/D-amino acid oxidase-like deaminating enzyme